MVVVEFARGGGIKMWCIFTVCTLSFAAARDIPTDVKSPIDVAHLQGLDTHYIGLFFSLFYDGKLLRNVYMV